MFGRLADQKNALSQVLYGLALRLVQDKPVLSDHWTPLQMTVQADCSVARHGWGITPNPSLAITYLSQAAANAADIEAQALGAGMKKGGAAKGELVLAIYELVCFPCSRVCKSDQRATFVPADRYIV